MNEEAAKKLREPFPINQIGQLPKAGTTLSYVGHAFVTDRLLQVDPEWSWEPVSFDADGAPLIRWGTKEASMWIRLTICGTTRLGVGIVAVNAFELEKQLISDALRNAAMRFGVALDLWSKQEDVPDTQQTGRRAGKPRGPQSTPTKAGNERRGPNVPEGYKTIEDARAAYAELAALVESIPAEYADAFKEWKDNQGFPYPYPLTAVVAMSAEVNKRLDAIAAESAPF